MNAFNPVEALPHNVELEQQIIGAILLNNDLLSAKCGMVREDHFFDPVHARIWSNISARIRKDHIASPVTLRSDMEADEGLKELGGAKYLLNLAGASVSSHALGDYTRELIELAERRKIVQKCREIVSATMAGGSTQDAISALELTVMDAQESDLAPRSMSLMAAHTKSLTEINEMYHSGNVGISSGLKTLDEELLLKRKRSTVIAGATSMGKTSLATFIAKAVADQGYGVAFVSLEMGEEDLANRINAIDSRVPYQAMDRPMSETLFRKVISAAEKQSETPIQIVTDRVRDMAGILSETKRLKKFWIPNDRMKGLGLLVIDYLQLVRGQGRPFDVLTQVSRDTKAIAKMLDIHVIGLAQVDRSLSKRDSKLPHLSDLRGSGDLENDADNVIFVHRPSYYLAREEPPEKADERADWEASLAATKGTADLIIAKQRMGSLATVRVGCDLSTNVFWDLAQQGSIEF